MTQATQKYNRSKIALWILSALLLILFPACLIIGSVSIPFNEVFNILIGNEATRKTWEIIVLETRLPMACTAMLAGAAISVAGLLLQTVFRNPLAGPEVLGVNSGAGLGVAVVMLLMQGVLAVGVAGYFALFAGAFIGAAIIIAVILFLSSILKNKVFLLIVGVAVGYLASSLISVLNYFATSEGVHSYLIWGMGSFSAVSLEQLPLYAVLTLFLLAVSLFMMKPLNALLLGEAYAHNLGVNVRLVRGTLLAVTGLLTAVVTAFCGPISFLGLAVPHIARLLFRTNNHRVLLPATLMCGALAALLCNIVCLLPGESGILPLGAITPLIGAPVIIYVVLNSKNL
jgi:iron complex transport system permease protein